MSGACVYNNHVSNLLPTKFYFPPFPTGFVARPQLLQKLDEALTRRLTLVSAPPGAGKTTLVSAWVQSARKKGVAFGWLSLDSGDNDLGRFLEYLAACLEEGGTVIDITVLPTGPGEQARLENTLADFIRGLMGLKQEVILVLDDYHLIHNNQIHTALQYFLDHAPSHLHLLLITRSDPPLELARLRVAGQLGELRMQQLRFSEQEAGEFLKGSAGLQLAQPEVSLLNSRAEGWIAGLQMAAISLRGAEDTSAFIAAFAGSHRYVFDYLIEQILNRQAPEVRDFLLKTSVLERMSAPLCDAVAGTTGAARGLLNTIERSNLFLVPLDDEHGWYRYHHLFADLLKLVLEQTHPGLASELHHLACHWYESQGLLAEALHHGLAAGDMELVAQIVSDNVLALVDHAEIVPILTQIDALPPEKRLGLPWLELAHAWGLAYIGRNDQASLALSRAEQNLDGLVMAKRDKMLGHIAAVRAYIAFTNGDQTEAELLAGQADKLLPLNEVAIRALNLTTLGNALIQNAEDPRSAEALEQAFLLAKQVGQSHVAMLAATGLSYTYEILGKFRRARQVCEEAIGMAGLYQRRNARLLTASAGVYAFLSRAWLEVGEFEKALSIARKGMELSELWGQVDTIMVCSFNLAVALGLTNQAESARQILQSARKIAQKASPWHVWNLEEAQLEITLDSDPPDIEEILREFARKQENGPKLPESVTARALLKQNRPAEALELLERVLARTVLDSSFMHVRMVALKALAYFQQKEYANALSSLEKALKLAEPENRVTSFLREGESMEKLLRLAQGKTSLPGFTRSLLAAFESRRKYTPQPAPAAEALVEPLSERELEVLQHLNSYLSTPEIAGQLVVSANTVRTHIKNIYGKLSVHGRSGAVRRARELGLLAK
jgi:LuxR family transcriptional regulator, maltose regulon positive regulatory protein